MSMIQVGTQDLSNWMVKNQKFKAKYFPQHPNQYGGKDELTDQICFPS